MADYIYGIKNLAQFFDLTPSDFMYLVNHNGVPGIRKLRRKAADSFPGGGRGVWALQTSLAEKYRDIRSNTPLYDPRKAVDALLNKYADSGATTIQELIDSGYIDDMDWCQQLNIERSRCYLHIPILMHKDDLLNWMGRRRPEDIPFESTKAIFKPIRVRR